MVEARSRNTVGDSTISGPVKFRFRSYQTSAEIWKRPRISAL